MSALLYYEGLLDVSSAKGMHKGSVSGSRGKLLWGDNVFINTFCLIT